MILIKVLMDWKNLVQNALPSLMVNAEFSGVISEFLGRKPCPRKPQRGHYAPNILDRQQLFCGIMRLPTKKEAVPRRLFLTSTLFGPVTEIWQGRIVSGPPNFMDSPN